MLGRVSQVTKSSKSRFLGLALMVLGVTTFMNTSSALATEVTISGRVGCAATASSLSVLNNTVTFEAMAPGSSASKAISYTLTQGKLEDCSSGTSSVDARFASLNGVASPTIRENFTFLSLGEPGINSVSVTATAPYNATLGAFAAELELTLSGD